MSNTKHERTALSVDKQAVQAAMPYLYKDGFSVSAYVRKVLWDYVAKKKDEEGWPLNDRKPLNIDEIEEIR